MLLASTMDNIGIGEAGVIALLGYAVVFLGLIALMIVVILLGKAFSLRKKEAKVASAEVSAPVAPVSQAPIQQPVAPGTAGELKLHDVPPKTAAMLMAIVAEQTGKPLNELRFTSIKEVK